MARFKVLKGKNMQPRILYSARISFKIEGEIKFFSTTTHIIVTMAKFKERILKAQEKNKALIRREPT